MSENHSRDVGVVNPLINESDAGIVDRDDCIAAACRYVLDEGIGVIVYLDWSASASLFCGEVFKP